MSDTISIINQKSAVKRHRNAISIEIKYDIIKKKEAGETTTKLAQDYGLSSSTISTAM